ncbi:MAG: DNA polymerase III subunit gamma/tau [Anaerolineales bacterium]|nr:DNA polymerase III subunit gamma/tau [Anaerolineales bacterium]
MSQSLYNKWRPKTWDEVIGQDHIIQTLKNAVAGERVVHAYLFAGPRGTGKTSTARLLAKAVNCLDEDPAKRPCNACDHCEAINAGRFLDLIEIDAASNTSVDDVRDLRDKINFTPNQGRYKVYIIDEVHMLSTAAFNALLKTLEEPPPHAIFILATTEVHKIPATVLSRCQRHEFRRIPVRDIVQQLERMVKAENLDVEEETLPFLARQATGSLRDAISLLDQLASTEGKITLAGAQAILGTATGETVIQLMESLLEGDTASGMERIHQALDAGSDPRQFARQIVDYMRGLLLILSGNADQINATGEVRSRMAAHALKVEPRIIIRMLQIFNRAASEARYAWQPALPLEMAFIESVMLFNQEEVTLIEKKETAKDKENEARLPKKSNQTLVSNEKGAPAKTEKPIIETDPLPENIKKNWDEIRSKTRAYDPITQALLNSCKPLGIYHGELILAFVSDVLRVKMEQGKHIENTSEALQEVIGETISIRCITTASERSRIPDGVDQDGMVATAVRDLGAEVVDSQ